jgi:hypothetical protein
MKPSILCAAVLLWCSVAWPTFAETNSISAEALAAPAEITQKPYLYEIARHLYRWQLDDAEIKGLYGNESIIFWVQRLNPRLDAGDKSVLAEIILPQLGINVKVKKADYRIEELKTTVKSRSFRIIKVARVSPPARRPEKAIEVKVPLEEIRDYLFKTRNLREYPDAALIERLRTAARTELTRELKKLTNAPTTDQTVYLSPLSPVANDLWVFWENGRMLFHFASDIDLSNPAVWDHESLVVRVFDIDQQVVGSHEEAPGSNRFLTRNQVGRVLYNCIVLGKEITLKPVGSPPSGTAHTPPNGQ